MCLSVLFYRQMMFFNKICGELFSDEGVAVVLPSGGGELAAEVDVVAAFEVVDHLVVAVLSAFGPDEGGEVGVLILEFDGSRYLDDTLEGNVGLVPAFAFL